MYMYVVKTVYNLDVKNGNIKQSINLLQEIAPYTGFGTLEDSKQSCDKLIPQAPKKDFIKMLENDGLVLRYEAVLVCTIRCLFLIKCVNCLHKDW